MKRIGLLQCDHVDERFRPIAGDHIDMFGALLPTVDLVPYAVCDGTLPASPDECDGWLATGSRRSVYDDEPWIHALAGFVGAIRDAGAPYAGICFGHQLLAHALGGRVARAAIGWGAGAHDMEVRDREPHTVTLLYMHQDQVADVPDGGTVLGSTDHCSVAMLRVGSSMLGIQAHPEYPAAYIEALLDARAARIGEEKVAAARASLARPLDAAVAAGWITDVLGGRAPA